MDKTGSSDRNSVYVAAGIIWRKGAFLAARRPMDKPRGGLWEFPGGKQEAGESMEEALARELREELGISIGIPALWRVVRHAYPDMTVIIHFMHVTEFSGEPQARDGQELRWVTPAEARALPFLPADVPLVAELQAPGEVIS